MHVGCFELPDDFELEENVADHLTPVSLQENCSSPYMLIGSQPGIETMRHLGLLQEWRPCPADQEAEDEAMLDSLGDVGLITRGLDVIHLGRRMSLSREREISMTIIVAWAVVWGFLGLGRIWAIWFGPADERQDKRVHGHGRFRVSTERPELQCWRRGFWPWISNAWAGEWIRRFGVAQGEQTFKMKPEDLGTLGDPKDDAEECFNRFSTYWRDETQKRGVSGRSLFRVLLRVIEYHVLVRVAIIGAVQFFLEYVAKVYVVDYAIRYISTLYQVKRPEEQHTLIPVLGVFVAFWIVPMTVVACDCTICMIDGRRILWIQQCLNAAAYRKAQRLPVTFQQTKSYFSDFNTVQHPDAEPQEDDKQITNLVNLVNFDITLATVGCTRTIIWSLLCIPTYIALMYIAFLRLKFAIFIGTACTIPILIIGIIAVKLNVQCAGKRQGFSHKRLEKLEEVLQSIRVVKACGWDEAAVETIMDMRGHEIEWLGKYWGAVGMFLWAVQNFGPILILATLVTHVFLYRAMDTSGIFVCLQVLNSIKNLTNLMGQHIQLLLLMWPSIKRVEKFLSQPEAPLYEERFAHQLSMGQPRNEGEPIIQVSGNFAWGLNKGSTVKDLNIQIRSGELVAVVGDVGSGKTSLLNVMLGELYPGETAHLHRPSRIAYCSQLPWIFEGTLRENVLFAGEYDETRYNNIVSAASLVNDLEVLPGGDAVLVGARGITVSGGQKSRIQLARAVYSSGTDLLLFDDPFGAVDAPTARHIMSNLVLGPYMNGRACVVVLQPEAEKLQHFSRVLVMREGRVVFDGPPKLAMEQPVFKDLLSQSLRAQQERIGAESASAAAQVARNQSNPRSDAHEATTTLRHEEMQGSTTWDTVFQYIFMGGRFAFLCNVLLYVLMCVAGQLSTASLATWADEGRFTPLKTAKQYITGYTLWWLVGAVVWWPSWFAGVIFCLHTSKYMHDHSLRGVMNAPIDTFFDKHPNGRIMNRMSSDLASIDMLLFFRFTAILAGFFSVAVPLGYVHVVMPLTFTLASSPVYVAIVLLLLKYWRTVVGLRYMMSILRSDLNSHYIDVSDQSVAMRAYQEMGRASYFQVMDQDAFANAQHASAQTIRLYVNNTINILFCTVLVLVALLAVLFPGWVGPGTLGLCLTNCFMVQCSIGQNMESCTGAQFEFIALNRVLELMPPSIPQESASLMPNDNSLCNIRAQVSRIELAPLAIIKPESKVQVVHKETRELLFEQSDDGTTLVCASESALSLFAPRVAAFKEPSRQGIRRRLVAVNGIALDAGKIASELLAGSTLDIDVQSGWLADGAMVQIEDLKVGYGGVKESRDVLCGISFEIAPKQKVGVVGTTGCGKSTLLLSLLRVLEPRSGKILLNGVDTTKVGLRTLRKALGLVPQDPTLFSGSIRHNLDPYDEQTEEGIKRAVKMVQLQKMVDGLPDGLDHQVAEGGGNLSFGQRQLMCLARMMLRRPGLLLLDEATSAIDPATQEAVTQALNMAFTDSTLVAVAHRLETILDFDMAIVLDKGHVVEKGPVKSLAATKEGMLSKMLAAKATW